MLYRHQLRCFGCKPTGLIGLAAHPTGIVTVTDLGFGFRTAMPISRSRTQLREWVFCRTSSRGAERALQISRFKQSTTQRPRSLDSSCSEPLLPKMGADYFIRDSEVSWHGMAKPPSSLISGYGSGSPLRCSSADKTF